MDHFAIGDIIPDFCFSTVNGNKQFSEYLQHTNHTLLLLLRFFGCPMAQFDLSTFKLNYPALQDAGIQVLAVVQSPAETILQYSSPESFPFPIACDPKEHIYQLLGTDSQRPDFDITQTRDPAIWDKLHRMSDAGFTLLKEEGNPLQLPAAFLLASDRKILYVHYGTWAGDTPDPKAILDILQNIHT